MLECSLLTNLDFGTCNNVQRISRLKTLESTIKFCQFENWEVVEENSLLKIDLSIRYRFLLMFEAQQVLIVGLLKEKIGLLIVSP